MDPLLFNALLLLLSIVGLILLGVPVAFSIGLSSALYFFIFTGGASQTLGQELFESLQGHPTLLAIPFFILSSAFLSGSGMAERIIRFAIAAVGWVRGGMAVASVFSCMIFAAISGSSPATVAAIGGISIDGMEKAGYTKRFGAGVIAVAGTLGILIPPSIVMVVYAAATEVSVRRMFFAGMLPGVLAGLMLMAVIVVFSYRSGMKPQKFKGFKELFLSFADSFWGLMMIVIILGGIYGGVFTPTEAAAVAAIYAFIVANFVYCDMGPLKERFKDIKQKPFAYRFVKKLSLFVLYLIPALFHKDNKHTLLQASKTTIMLMFIIANALVLKYVLTDTKVVERLAQVLIQGDMAIWTFLIIVNVILLIGGQFMEPSGLLYIVVPVIFPIAVQLGVDPIHLGIMVVVNMEIGMITPPVGLNLFVTSGITRLPVQTIVRSSMPFVAVMFVFLFMITYIPALTADIYRPIYGPECPADDYYSELNQAQKEQNKLYKSCALYREKIRLEKQEAEQSLMGLETS